MRFQYKLILLFGLLFGAAMVLMLAFSIQSQKRLVAEVNGKIETIMQAVHFSTQSLSSEKPRPRDELDHFINQAVRHPAIKEISVVGRNHEIVASSNPEKIGKRQSALLQQMILREEFGYSDSLARYEMIMPITRENQVIGQVQATVILPNFGELIRDLYRKNLLVAAVVFLAAILISYLAIHRLNKPLRGLGHAASRVAQGDYSVQIELPGADEFGRVAQSFNHMTSRLMEQKKLEEDLRGMERNAILAETGALLAHEIRNPLNLINLTAGHLARNYHPQDPAQIQSYRAHFDNLELQVRQLNSMVEQFISAGKPLKVVKRSCRPADLLSQVEALIKHRLIAREILLDIEIAEREAIPADPELLRLVFQNLLLNAIVASPVQSRIRVSMERTDGSVIIKVADSGPGIDPEDVENVFKPYFTKSPGGTGLGLTLVRRIVEEHGGSISVSNGAGGGACFLVVLPEKE